jgi:hypothetical protein
MEHNNEKTMYVAIRATKDPPDEVNIYGEVTST